MKAALKEAEKAEKIDETPIGAVIVRDGKIIARGYNKRETKKNEQLTAFLNRKISFFDFMENNYNDIEILSDYIGFNKDKWSVSI